MRRASFVVVLFGLLALEATHVQEPIAPGSLLRIMRCTPQCALSSGTLLGLSQDHSSLVLHFGEELGPVEVPFDRIQRIEVSRGRESDKLGGAMLGGLGFDLFLLEGGKTVKITEDFVCDRCVNLLATKGSVPLPE